MRKKAHPDKNVVIVTRSTKRVAFLSLTRSGKISDKQMAEEAQLTYPRGTRWRQDLGLAGYAPKGTRTYMPKQSRRRPTRGRRRCGSTCIIAFTGYTITGGWGNVKRGSRTRSLLTLPSLAR